MASRPNSRVTFLTANQARDSSRLPLIAARLPVLFDTLPPGYLKPAKIKPTDSPLTFRTDGLGRPAEVTLVPYYRIAHEHYNLYWKIVGA